MSISDVDATLNPAGIYAVTLTATNGTMTLTTLAGLTFSGGSDGTADATMSFSGTLAAINAALATATYTPTANYSGPATITLNVTDIFGGIVATGTGAATNDSDVVNVTVTSTPDAPTIVGPPTVALANIVEDATNPAGATVSALFGPKFADGDGDTLAGVAITANSATAADGVWQYFSGGVWTNLPAVSTGSALLVASADLLRFVPAHDFSGVPSLTVNMVDSSGGAITTGQTADLSTTGGTTRYSPPLSLTQTVTAIADGANIELDAGGPHKTLSGGFDPFTFAPLDPTYNVGTSDEDRPRTAATTDGGWVMVWTQSTGTPQVLAQRFHANGDLNGGLVTVTPLAGPSETQPAVTSLAGGGFAVAYVSNGGGEITVAIYSASSTSPTASLVLPNTGAEQTPTITRLSNGEILVTWEVPGGGSTQISGIRLDANGALIDATPQSLAAAADNFHANNNPTPHSVTALAGGTFAVTWVEGGNVKVVVYTPGATWTAGAIVTLDEGSSVDRSPDVVALSDGRFLVVWESSDGGPSDLWGQFFTAGGTAAGGHVLLTGAIPSSEFTPNVTALDDGGFALTWIGNDGPNNTGDVRLQTFDATGAAVSGVRTITSTGFTPNPGAGPIAERDAVLTTLSDGRIVLSWIEPDPDTNPGPEPSQDDIRYQVYDPGGTPELEVAAGGTIFDLPMDVSLFDPSESLDVVIIQGLADFGHGLVVGHYDANFDYDPGNFLDAAWVIVRGYNAAETAFLDALLAGTVEVQIQLGGPSSIGDLFVIGITAITSDGGSQRQALTRDLTIEFISPNAAPTLDLDANDSSAAGTGYTAAFTEGGAAVLIADSDVAIADADAGDMIEGATIAIQSAVVGDQLTLGAQGGFVVTGSGTGTITITGTGTAAQYEAMLELITFSSSSDDPGASRTINITVTDGSANSNIAVATINITQLNDAPTLTATGGTPTFTEGGAAVDLFSTVSASTIEAGQTFTSMTLTVTNVTESDSEILTIDGSDVALANGNAVVTTGQRPHRQRLASPPTSRR